MPLYIAHWKSHCVALVGFPLRHLRPPGFSDRQESPNPKMIHKAIVLSFLYIGIEVELWDFNRVLKDEVVTRAEIVTHGI